jgi:hypothetical protein
MSESKGNANSYNKDLKQILSENLLLDRADEHNGGMCIMLLITCIKRLSIC